MGNIKITIPQDLKKSLQAYGNQIARNLAITFRNELTKEYQRSIEIFYSSYTPRQYKRKWQLRNSFRPFYRNPHGTRFRGGVEITSDNMASVYHDSPSEVLSTALSGYHGRPELGIYTSPEIYEHMIKYQELLFANAESYAGEAIAAASF